MTRGQPADMADKLFGKHAVAAVLAGTRKVHRLYLLEGIGAASVQDVLDLARKKGVGVNYVPRHWLDKQADGAVHQGVMAEAEDVKYWDLGDLVAAIPSSETPFLIALDQVQDPHNLGAIIRTAGAVGAHGVIIPERRAASLSGGTLKASAGVAEWFPVARVVNLPRAIEDLKKQGFWAIGADGDAPDLHWKVDFARPLVLVVGGEDRGLGRLVREKCDMLARLPMQPAVQSLNASVAAAVMAYEVLRQRSSVVYRNADAP